MSKSKREKADANIEDPTFDQVRNYLALLEIQFCFLQTPLRPSHTTHETAKNAVILKIVVKIFAVCEGLLDRYSITINKQEKSKSIMTDNLKKRKSESLGKKKAMMHQYISHTQS